MSDLIDREAAIEKYGDLYVEKKGRRGFISDMRHFLEMLPSAEPQWIPCSERLPKDDQTVLITHRGGVSVGWYNGIYWERGASTNHRGIKTVTAWMTLPEPYKEG